MLSDWFFLVKLHRERHRDFLRWAEAERQGHSVRRRQAKDGAAAGGSRKRRPPLQGLNAA